MENNITEINKALANECIPDGHIQITILFHNGRWKDIFIKILLKKSIGTEIIGRIGFGKVLKECNDFPAHGQVEIELLLEDKTIVDYKITKTNRIHNKGCKL